MATETRTCHLDGAIVGVRDFCPACVERFPHRQNAETMTAEERAAELDALIGVLELPFTMLHERITEVVGRDVFTHELAYPDALIAEIRRGEAASFQDVLDKIPADKLVIVVKTD